MIITPDTLVTKLNEGKVDFKFRKSDGSIREATGTTKVDLIPVAKRPATMADNASTPTIVYFDLSANDWRSLRRDSLIG